MHNLLVCPRIYTPQMQTNAQCRHALRLISHESTFEKAYAYEGETQAELCQIQCGKQVLSNFYTYFSPLHLNPELQHPGVPQQVVFPSVTHKIEGTCGIIPLLGIVKARQENLFYN